MGKKIAKRQYPILSVTKVQEVCGWERKK